MTIDFQPIELCHEHDTEGRLVLIEGKLAAILARLSDTHGPSAGKWFIECAFGPFARCDLEFEDLDAARAWFEQRLSD